MIRNKYYNTLEDIAGYMYPNKYIYFDWEAYTDKDGVHRFHQIQAIDYFENIVCNMVSTQVKLEAKHLVVGLCTTERYKLFSQVEHDDDIVNAFCKNIFNQYRNYTGIAHYGKGYDFIFIIDWLEIHGERFVPIIWNGNKITNMKIPQYKIRFVDNISLIINTPVKTFEQNIQLTRKGIE